MTHSTVSEPMLEGEGEEADPVTATAGDVEALPLFHEEPPLAAPSAAPVTSAIPSKKPKADSDTPIVDDLFATGDDV